MLLEVAVEGHLERKQAGSELHVAIIRVRNTVLRAILKENFAAPNFRGSRPIREKRENYAPRKFGAIRYILQ